MKRIFALLACLVLLCTLSLTSCIIDIDLSGKDTDSVSGYSEITADGKKDSAILFRSFFGDTFKKTRITIKATLDGNDYFVEELDGTTDCTRYTGPSGITSYCYIADNDFYYASSFDDTKTIVKSKEKYDEAYALFRQMLENVTDLETMVPTDSASYLCTHRTEDDGTSTLSFEAKAGDNTYTIQANAKNDLVEKATLTMSGSETSTITLVFEYDKASVSLPNFSDYRDISSEEDNQDPALLFGSFFEDTFAKTRITVTATLNGEDYFVEDIDGTTDCTRYTGPSGITSYCFIVDNEFYYASSFDDTKTIVKSKEKYDDAYALFKQMLENITDVETTMSAGPATYTAAVTGEDSKSQTLTLTAATSDATYTLMATSKDGLVSKTTLTITGNEPAVIEFVFGYDADPISLPNTADWTVG